MSERCNKLLEGIIAGRDSPISSGKVITAHDTASVSWGASPEVWSNFSLLPLEQDSGEIDSVLFMVLISK